MKYLILVKNKFVMGFILLFLILMIVYPRATYQGASSGLLLWFHNILPNLLPFIIVSNLMIRLKLTKKVSRVFYPLFKKIFGITLEGCYPVLLGFLSGIPMGAKSSADLVNENKISREEGQFIFTMCNNASPMFVIGYIAITQLKLPQIKYALFLLFIGSAMISAQLCRFIFTLFQDKKLTVFGKALHIASLSESKEDIYSNKKSDPIHFSFAVLDEAIMNGFEVVTKIGGYVILFSILAQIVRDAGSDIGILKAILMGILEITVGINQICSSEIDIHTKIVLVATITAFGGLSGMAQTKSVIGETRLSMIYYFIVKLVNAVIAGLLALLYVSFL